MGAEAELAERLRFKQQVTERLASQPSDTRGPHCWYCAKIVPWWTCDCPKARAAQQARDAGKREGYPRWNAKTGCIENLDAETIAFNEALGFKRYPGDGVSLVSTAHPRGPGIGRGHGGIRKAAVEVIEVEIVDSVDSTDAAVNTETVHATAQDDAGVDSVDKLAARRAYKAEHERQRRQDRKNG